MRCSEERCDLWTQLANHGAKIREVRNQGVEPLFPGLFDVGEHCFFKEIVGATK